jgi:hypothetical protein
MLQILALLHRLSEMKEDSWTLPFSSGIDPIALARPLKVKKKIFIPEILLENIEYNNERDKSLISLGADIVCKRGAIDIRFTAGRAGSGLVSIWNNLTIIR